MPIGSNPRGMTVQPGERHWETFVDLCRHVGATGNVVTDADVAALSFEAGATFVTADRGFTRFPGVRVQHPMDD
jgi:uncharacterized protein